MARSSCLETLALIPKWNVSVDMSPTSREQCFYLKGNYNHLTLIVMKLFICITYVNQGNQSSLHYLVCAVEFTRSSAKILRAGHSSILII